ncbi:MAG: hypothetical protein K5648_00285 [Erysipelotrichaceae bacterium]|nr:hypothetical protein [Erysipelotrichaceae bacterium]
MKKLFTLLAVLLLLAGCSAKKETAVKEETKEETKTESASPAAVNDPLPDLYGTWRTAAVSVNGARFTMDQIIAMGEKGSVDAILVLREDGTLSIYIANDGSRYGSTWQAGADGNSVIIEGREMPLSEGELILQFQDGNVHMEKISERQDEAIIDELLEAETQEPAEEDTKEVEPEEETKEEPSSDLIRPETKEAIDAYEDFVDEYIAFMEKYEDSDGSDLSLLIDYTNFMTKLTDYTDKMEKMEDDMTEAEMVYYLEVMNRCNEKIIKAAY